MGAYQVGDVIRRTRESMGITQMELCDGICSVETLSRIENGKQIPNRANYCALMERMGKYSEKYLPLVHTEKIDIILEAQKMNIAAIRREYDKMDLELESFQKKIDRKDPLNRQFVLRMRALIDYYLGRISEKEKREQLEEAFLCTVPGYTEGELPRGLYTRNEIMIFCNIAGSYSEEGNNDMAVHMLQQVREYFRITIVSGEERGASEVLALTNLGHCLGKMERFGEAIEVNDEAVEICKREGNSGNLDNLLYHNGFNRELYGGTEEECKELLLQAYFVGELNHKKVDMQFFKNHMQKMYGDVL